MENIRKKAAEIIGNKCGQPYKVSVYMNHVIIMLPPNDGTDFYHACRKAESEVTKCINANLPNRGDDILFSIRRDGEEEHIFRVYKHVS